MKTVETMLGGVRPSPGAATPPNRLTPGIASGRTRSGTRGFPRVSRAPAPAAPEDGRTPGAVSKCALLGALLGGLLQPGSAWACAACYGQSDSPLAAGMNWGIMSLLGMIVMVLGGFAAFFVFLARRAASVAAAGASSARSEARLKSRADAAWGHAVYTDKPKCGGPEGPGPRPGAASDTILETRGGGVRAPVDSELAGMAKANASA